MTTSSDGARNGRGTVVISYDDGDSRDLTSAFPVHKSYGVPAEVCVPSSYVDQEGRLTKSQLLDLQAAGWEVVSHTKHHIGLGEEPLSRPADPGDDRLYLSRHTRFKPGIEVRVAQGGASELARVVARGEDSRGGYLQLERGINSAFDSAAGPRPLRWLRRLAGDPLRGAVVSVSPEQAREEIEMSRLDLEAMGLVVRHFTYPWGRLCSWTRTLVAASYESARAVSAPHSRTGSNDPHALPSTSFEGAKDFEARVLRIVDRAADRGGLSMFHAHTRNRAFSEALLERLIERCLQRGLRISTRSDYFAAPRSRTGAQ
jgi:peptidoglycan/xylan/chitin deacetylase (PgdA/CDA1 family)